MIQEPKKKGSMHSYCPECGALITNALGICHFCRYQDSLADNMEYDHEDWHADIDEEADWYEDFILW